MTWIARKSRVTQDEIVDKLTLRIGEARIEVKARRSRATALGEASGREGSSRARPGRAAPRENYGSVPSLQIAQAGITQRRTWIWRTYFSSRDTRRGLERRGIWEEVIKVRPIRFLHRVSCSLRNTFIGAS